MTEGGAEELIRRVQLITKIYHAREYTDPSGLRAWADTTRKPVFFGLMNQKSVNHRAENEKTGPRGLNRSSSLVGRPPIITL